MRKERVENMEELWLEDGRLNPNALFGDVDDCSACPFYRDNVRLFDTDYVCHNNPPHKYFNKYYAPDNAFILLFHTSEPLRLFL